MTKNTLMLSMGLLTASVAATTVEAQNRNCGPHEMVTAHLADKYGESRQMMGLAANNTVMELFVSPETGTWTITATNGTGLACLVASGTDADTMAMVLPEDTDPDA